VKRTVRLLTALALALGLAGIEVASPVHAQTTDIGCPDFAGLGSAISAAGSGDILQIHCASATTIAFTTPLTIGQNLTLDASGSTGAVTFDAGSSTRLLSVTSGVSLELNTLTLSNGHVPTSGGAIFEQNGTLTIIDSTFSDNSAGGVGGAIDRVGGTLSVSGSTFTGNSALDGGAIDTSQSATTTISNSTFSENSSTDTTGAGAGGGAIFTNSAGVTTLAVSSSTFSGNSAASDGGAINANGPTDIGGTIIAGSTSGGNCSITGNLTDDGHNLTDSNGDCGLNAGTGDLTGTDPDLDALAGNGGPTGTMALPVTSQAVDAIPASSGLCPAFDQRGVSRQDNGETSCDIGAYEYVEAGLGCPTFSALAAAIAGASSGERLLFSCASPTIITFTSTLTPSTSVTLDASGSAGSVTLDGGGNVRLFSVASGVGLELQNLTLSHGSAGSSSGGGAISMSGGTVTIDNSTVSNNTATGGGAVFMTGGTLAIENSTFSGNSVPVDAGAIDNEGGSFTIGDSTFWGNSAGGAGGAIYNDGSPSTISNSTFSGNSAQSGQGGAIWKQGPLTISGTIIAGNPGGNCSLFAGDTDAGYNLTDGGGNCGLGGSTDLTNTDPQLGALADNGGPTQTMALPVTSPAVDVIPISSGLCPAADQRGVARPDTGESSCDIGAYELSNSAGPGLSQSIIFDPILDKTYGDPPITANAAGGDSGNPVFFSIDSSSTGGVCTSSGTNGSTIAITGPGTCSVDANQLGNDSYERAPQVQQSFTISPHAPVTDCPTTESALSSDISTAGPSGTVLLNCASPTTIAFGSPISISQNLTLDASGSTGAVTFDGGGSHQLFSVGGVTFVVKNITLSHGSSFGGSGAITQTGGTLAVSNSTFVGNINTNPRGFGGALVQIGGTLTVTSSTFSGNSAPGGGAIGVDNGTTTSIQTSTFTNNSATSTSSAFGGGAIFTFGSAGTLAVSDSTFSSNSSSGGGGGAIFSTWPVTIGATIIAGSTSGGNCSIKSTLTDHGYNLTDSNGDCGINLGTGDQTNTNPQLGPLADNGGPTQTMALEYGSPAIDVIPTASGLCAAADQRGFSRPDTSESVCDIGAFESDYIPTSISTTGSGSSSTFGQTVLFTATVTPASGTVSPSGTVTFTDGGTTLGTAVLSPVSGGTATATFATCSLDAVGSPHTITSSYSGDAAFDPSNDAIGVQQTVGANPSVTSCAAQASNGGSEAQAVAGGSNPGDAGSIAGTATGATTPTSWVSVASYGSNPADTSPPGGGSYLDVKISSATDFTGVTIVDCDLVGGASSLYWYDGASWQQVAASQVTFGDPAAGCATITVGSGDTSPSLSDLIGTPFASSSSPTMSLLKRSSMERYGSLVTVHWTMADQAGVVGFRVSSGPILLTRGVIPVHTARRYTVTARDSSRSRLTLHVLFRDGQQKTIPLR
jgi:predicted outer membrane repeat protein